MPIYEYKCNKCGDNFEQIVFPSDDESNFECPSCCDKDISRIVSSFSKDISRIVSSFSRGSGDPGRGSVSSGCSPSGGFS
ncbi:MAG: zinc ribbon domain-containing protein [Deltaproteobacteria bacterium]|nr:zinc ribbon domain-containing protein [Deltaproteobacteria bacterium]